MTARTPEFPRAASGLPEASAASVVELSEGERFALRLENRFDGTHETQDPVGVGGSFSARVTFPDPGVYWYQTV